MREIKLLHAADLHLDSAFESVSPAQATERRKGQRKLLFKLAEIAEERGAAALLLCGDVFDGNSIDSETERDFCRALGALPCPVLIAPGNHDPYAAHSVWETMRLPENIYVFKNAEPEPVQFAGVPVRFWGAGFQNTFSPPLLRSFTAPQKGELADVMVLHGDLGPATAEYNPVSRDDLMKCGMDYVALGHIHIRSALQKLGDTAFAYSGCTEGRGYDETGEKGALLVTISESGATAEFVPLGGVRYEIITVEVGGKDALSAASDAIAQLTENDCCRLILTGECGQLPDIPALRKKLEGHLRELQIRDETTVARDIWAQLGQNTLSGAYLDRLYIMYNAAENAEERQKIELAARYGLSAIENGGDLI